MRLVTLETHGDEKLQQMEQIYGRFDLGIDGNPLDTWVNRNLRLFRFPEPMKHAYFPDVYVRKTKVNRRMHPALGEVFNDMVTRWEPNAREVYGLRQFVKCFNFGDGDKPNLFWYGAAWELSPAVTGEALTEAIQIFTKHGFKHDRKRIRTFEFW